MLSPLRPAFVRQKRGQSILQLPTTKSGQKSAVLCSQCRKEGLEVNDIPHKFMRILEHGLDLNPHTRWTAVNIAEAFRQMPL